MTVQVKGNLRFENNSAEWLVDKERQADKIVLTMATDIHRIASLNAPIESGQLIRSGRITRKGLAYYIISFGGGSVKYARRRHYENKKNPQTLRYLEKAGNSVSRNFIRYLEASK